MNKKDLKDGMIVKLRNETYNSILHNNILRKNEDKYEIIVNLRTYNNDMTFHGNKYLDIMKIYDPEMNLLWKRKEIDWTKVPKDTKVLVRMNKNEEWKKCHFHSYEKNLSCVYFTYDKGKTSWSSNHEYEYTPWKYCKLAEGEYERLQKEDIL